MKNTWTKEAILLGGLLCLGLISIGYLIGSSMIEFRSLERSVTVKGLSEREVPADTVIWPIKFISAENDVNLLYKHIEEKAGLVVKYLYDQGFDSKEISINTPYINDKQANSYSNAAVTYRYFANQTVTVYSHNIEKVRSAMNKITELGKSGVLVTGDEYSERAEYLFTKLNDIKPEMIEEATRKSREVAQKFAKDSDSRLGKIKKARQGQFSIENRDNNTPYIKKVRVVTSVEYYLSD
ncbi:MAG: SIMPL domain-containing protein [Deltaproteobacteria bacterium]|nr:SIMPL domain-containing protein [Deltaproteobacteria bacterium]